ncbi:hypothetical protein DFP72DRAFT_865423 [Ephemerocybe angulata]|uniref:Uncharacterized protein n=1 Tax=Ephemerocybe angulata TaxID=980116 RepID=A0A8H6MEU8_9AGAR|nr:hypothetical protein DFP72DRAFT_865423 [Tulosesus angulatus]
MLARNDPSLAMPQVAGGLAVVVFIFTLLAFVVESQLTQYVQTNLQYRHPFFLFYIVHSTFRTAPQPHRFPRAAFTKLVSLMTIGVTYPGLLWFAAVSLASDVTAIWNTNAFFAYLISVRLFKLKWELGTIAVVYGGASASEADPKPASASPHDVVTSTTFKPSAPLLGNLLTLIASFGYWSLPITSDSLYRQLSEDDAEPEETEMGANEHASLSGEEDACLEPFALPPNMHTALSIFGIAFGGMVFNAGFMVLLGVWGPIITSVGNLLTIVLMLISDIIFGSGLESITLWSLLGSGVIVADNSLSLASVHEAAGLSLPVRLSVAAHPIGDKVE